MIQGFTKSRLALALTLAIGASSMAYAADTTSSMRGTISGPDGQPAPNTKITLIHQPSGTVTEVTTNASGAFSASGLRVGGPYQIIIDSDVYQDTVESDIFLQLGQTFRLNEQLQAASNVERITVTGSRIAMTNNSGSSSTFGLDAIENAPSFNRDLKDIIRQNPLASTLGGSDNAMSVAGQNPKFNSISVDGVGLNDDFGLNSNGYPTQRSPVSMDAIEQVSIETNPFDAKYGGFTGARVNAVTKSGTNEFHGGVFYEKTDDSWAGKAKNPNTGAKVDVTGVESETYGFNLGGPLIKDKLFFFVNYEDFSKPETANYGPEGSGAPNETVWTMADYQRVRDFTNQTYGFDIGDWNASPEVTDKKYMAKIDWNVNNDHRLAFTYNKVKGNQLRNTTSNEDTLRASTNWYDNIQDMESYSLQWFADWTDSFSTELAVSYKDVATGQIPPSKAIGQVTIYTDADHDHELVFGPDYARQANELQTKTWKVDLSAEYLLGDHKLSAGWNYERLDIFNLYARNALGAWEFDSIADYEAGNASTLYYANAYTGDVNDAAANFVIGTNALYVQDEWALSDSIDLVYGLRYERYFADDKPAFNQTFFDRYGFSNQENLDGLDILLPRLGLTWYATDALTVRAGAGRYSGGKPNVWLSNAFSNDGVTLVSFSDRSMPDDSYLTNVDIRGVPAEVQATLQPGDGEVNPIDPNFKVPSIWRFSLGFDYTFDIPSMGDGYLWHAEAIHAKNKDDNAWRNLNSAPTGEVTSDGRIVYAPLNGDRYDLMLTNADKSGKSTILTTSLSKEWENGLSMSMSYTHQDVDEGNAGTSSTASSNYGYNYVIDRNEDYVGTSYYEIKHSLKLTLGYSHEFFQGYETKFNAFFERRSGQPFTWAMRRPGTALGDPSRLTSTAALYLPYIPTGPDDTTVGYANNFSYEQFMNDYVIPAGLEGYAGGFADKNAGTSPWINTMDVSISQEVPGFMKGHKGQIYLTVQNFLNLLNDDWGQVETNGYSKRFADFSVANDGQIIYSPLSSGLYKDPTWEDERSTWYLKIGVKYTF
ncbi:TonB-dependent receptor [Shewanella avicenniae]|uniref:TonB-dependent receptor n=2 Tax=Shewanella avicenniae TaxID=2814294 RepID=A0ABX7QVU9_9GAMM|nr:TonB-dependent receptor [Shewanella avicenniae]